MKLRIRFHNSARIFSALMVAAMMTGQLSLVQAGEHPLSTITGPQVDLKAYDHAIAGSVHGFVVWGEVDEASFTSKLLMRRDGQTVSATFQRTEDKKVRGTIRHVVDDRTVETTLEFVRIDRESSKIHLLRNGAPVEVAISADGFANNHFENPVYRATIDGKEHSYALNGQACYAYSLHLAFLILGALTH